MKTISLVLLSLGLLLTGTAADDKSNPHASGVPAAWADKVTDIAELPVERYDWGTVQWLANRKLMPGSEQTMGLATILPGKQNAAHYHPNCEEILYVLSGEGLQHYDDRVMALKAGMTIRIPAKVKHSLANTGREPLRALVSFSSGDRKTVWLSSPGLK